MFSMTPQQKAQFNRRANEVGWLKARAEFVNQLQQESKTMVQDPPSGTTPKVTPMTLAQAQKAVARLAKFGIANNRLFARRVPATGGVDLGAEVISEQQIIDQGLQKQKLLYELHTPKPGVGPFDLAQHVAKLDRGIAGFAELWTDRNPGGTTSDAYAGLLTIPSVVKAVNAELAKL